MVVHQLNFDSLNLLLKAKSKDVVAKCLNDAFAYRNGKVPAMVYDSISNGVGCEHSEANELFINLQCLVKQCLYEGFTDKQSILGLFPGDFHKNLRELLTKMILENIANWRSQVLANQVSLPKLIDFDWRVDVKTSSDATVRMSLPTCIVQMKIQENSVTEDQLPELRCLNVELSKKTLDTMLDGLGKIRDQLSSVAQSASS